VSVLDLSTSRSTNSGIYVLQNSPPEDIPGFKYSATRSSPFRSTFFRPGLKYINRFEFRDFSAANEAE